MISGAEIMVKCLQKENVSIVFGYPGAVICPFFDYLYQTDIKAVLVRQEQNAAHSASGYARALSKVGVCVATSGPGALNMITGIATAYMDSIPLVCITGQVKSDVLGRDVFQEADITGACESFVKHSYLVKNPDDIPRVFREAFYIASTGRKGPVLIDIPMDVQEAELKKDFSYPDELLIRGYKPEIKINPIQLRRVVSLLDQSEKPLLCAGGGVILADGEPVIREFCEKFNIPLVHTMMGMGVLPKKHPLNFGMLGNNGKPYANKALVRADLLIVVGARIADRAIPKPENLTRRAIIHIDIDTAEIGKNIGPTVPLVGDLKEIFSLMRDAEISRKDDSWISELDEIKKNTVDTRVFSDRFVDPNLLVQTLSEKLNDDAIYVADVGQNQLWSADNYVMKEGRFITTGGMGTMGYSIPAAIGAKFVFPDRQTVAVCGDGAFQMSMNELATMREQDVDIRILLVRNNYLGLVREFQHYHYDSHYEGVELGRWPDYGKIAEAYGLPYNEVSSNSELDEKLNWLLEGDGARMLVCDVDSENNVK